MALRADFDAAGLRALARTAKDGPQTRRLLALAAIDDGSTRGGSVANRGTGAEYRVLSAKLYAAKMWNCSARDGSGLKAYLACLFRIM